MVLFFYRVRSGVRSADLRPDVGSVSRASEQTRHAFPRSKELRLVASRGVKGDGTQTTA